MTAKKAAALVVPTTSGRDALQHLTKVPWTELAHAAGTGRTGTDLSEDVAAALTRLGDKGRTAGDDAVAALFASLCDRGTIFQATAYAVPFLCALTADVTLPGRRQRGLGLLLGNIAIAASYESHDSTSPGAFGPGVGEKTREAFLASEAHLVAISHAHPALRWLMTSITQLITQEHVDDDDRARIANRFELLESDDSEDDDQEDDDDDDGDHEEARDLQAVPVSTQRVSHLTFGGGILLAREGEKLHVRFDDGATRVMLARFVQLVPDAPHMNK